MLQEDRRCFQNSAEGFSDIDTALSAVKIFLQDGNPNIQFTKGNEVFAPQKYMHIYIAIINSEGGSGKFGQYFQCKGYPKLKCTARAVGQYEFDKKSIQNINAIFQSCSKRGKNLTIQPSDSLPLPNAKSSSISLGWYFPSYTSLLIFHFLFLIF